MQTLIKKAREDGKYPVMMNNYTVVILMQTTMNT